MNSELAGRIVTGPAILAGKPVARGTRITVEHIRRELASGGSVEELLREYSRLKAEDIRAAQLFAADYLAGQGCSVLDPVRL